MPRGPRKSLEEKIADKKNIIEALKIRIKSEQEELEEMLKEKKAKDVEALSNMLKGNGLSTEDAAKILQDYIERKTA